MSLNAKSMRQMDTTYVTYGTIFRAKPRLRQTPAPPVANQ